MSLPRGLQTQRRQNPLLNPDILKALLIDLINYIGAHIDILVEYELRNEDVRLHRLEKNFAIDVGEFVSREVHHTQVSTPDVQNLINPLTSKEVLSAVESAYLRAIALHGCKYFGKRSVSDAISTHIEVF